MNDFPASTRSPRNTHELDEGPSLLLQLISSGRAIGFFAHFICYVLTCVLVLVAAGPFPAGVTALGWGIGLVLHGFFALFVPLLRLARSADAEPELPLLPASLAKEIGEPISAARNLLQQIAQAPDAGDSAQHARTALAELERAEHAIAHWSPAPRSSGRTR